MFSSATSEEYRVRPERSLSRVAKAWLPLVSRILGRQPSCYNSDSVHTPDQLECTLYDPECRNQNNSRSKLLNVHEIISLQDGWQPDQTPKGVIRFNTDWRAKAADTLMLTSVFLTIMITPVTTIWDGRWDEEVLVPGGVYMLLVDMGLDVAYAAYLILKLNMSFLHPTKRVEIIDRDRIRGKWARNPLYWLMWLTALTYIPILAGAQLWLNHLKFFRAQHLFSMPDSLWRLQDKFWVRFLRPIILLIGASHWCACLLYCYGGYREKYFDDGPEAHQTTFNKEAISGSFSLYLMAFVEALYMLTGALDNPLGDGGIRDRQFGSLVLVSMFGPIGTIVMSLFISSVVRQQSMAYALDMRHEENKAFMSRALRILNIPKALQWRVLSMHYYQRMGHDVEAFNELFSKKHMSPALENSLLLYLYRDTVVNSAYFKQKDPTYIIEVLRALQFQVYLPGDYVARHGEIATVMYFVSKGVLSVRVPNTRDKSNVAKAIEVAKLRKGDHFGEIGLFQDSIRTAWVRADTYALVSALPRDSIEPIWHYFTAEREELLHLVQDTVERDRHRINRQRWKFGFNMVKNGVLPGVDGSDSTTASVPSVASDSRPSEASDELSVQAIRTGFIDDDQPNAQPREDSEEVKLESLEDICFTPSRASRRVGPTKSESATSRGSLHENQFTRSPIFQKKGRLSVANCAHRDTQLHVEIAELHELLQEIGSRQSRLESKVDQALSSRQSDHDSATEIATPERDEPEPIPRSWGSPRLAPHPKGAAAGGLKEDWKPKPKPKARKGGPSRIGATAKALAAPDSMASRSNRSVASASSTRSSRWPNRVSASAPEADRRVPQFGATWGNMQSEIVMEPTVSATPGSSPPSPRARRTP